MAVKIRLLDRVREKIHETMIYPHAFNRSGRGVVSPLDAG